MNSWKALGDCRRLIVGGVSKDLRTVVERCCQMVSDLVGVVKVVLDWRM